MFFIGDTASVDISAQFDRLNRRLTDLGTIVKNVSSYADMELHKELDAVSRACQPAECPKCITTADIKQLEVTCPSVQCPPVACTHPDSLFITKQLTDINDQLASQNNHSIHFLLGQSEITDRVEALQLSVDRIRCQTCPTINTSSLVREMTRMNRLLKNIVNVHQLTDIGPMLTKLQSSVDLLVSAAEDVPDDVDLRPLEDDIQSLSTGVTELAAASNMTTVQHSINNLDIKLSNIASKVALFQCPQYPDLSALTSYSLKLDNKLRVMSSALDNLSQHISNVSQDQLVAVQTDLANKMDDLKQSQADYLDEIVFQDRMQNRMNQTTGADSTCFHSVWQNINFTVCANGLGHGFGVSVTDLTLYAQFLFLHFNTLRSFAGIKNYTYILIILYNSIFRFEPQLRDDIDDSVLGLDVVPVCVCYFLDIVLPASVLLFASNLQRHPQTAQKA